MNDLGVPCGQRFSLYLTFSNPILIERRYSCSRRSIGEGAPIHAEPSRRLIIHYVSGVDFVHEKSLATRRLSPVASALWSLATHKSKREKKGAQPVNPPFTRPTVCLLQSSGRDPLTKR